MIHARQFSLAIITSLVTMSLASHANAQTHHDTILGTVTTDSGKVIAGADVIVTIAPTRDSRGTQTDSSGHYSMIFVEGTGDYLVHVSADGYAAFRKRVTRVGTDSVFTVNVTLARTGGQQLPAVKITASKPKPDRDADMYGSGVGASEQTAGGVNGAVSPDEAGDLVAIGATIPGVAVTPNGLSIGGLGVGQNSTTINGMAFGGADIPRDAYTSVHVSGSTYDPARGWFGGLNENVVMDRGGLFAGRQAHITVDAPVLQSPDPIATGLGQRFSNIVGSFGGVGSMDEDKYTYNYGMQAGRRTSDIVGLPEADAALLQRAGVSADSVARLLNVLTAAGVPIRARGVPTAHVSQGASFIARFDHAPYDWSNFHPARTTWGLLGYGKLSSDNATNVLPTSTPAHGGSGSDAVGMLQGLFSTYFHGDYLNEERSGVTLSRNKSNPYLALPDGRVLIASSFPDGTGGLTSLDFGGNSSMLSDTRRWTWETTSATQFYARGQEAHKISLDADSRFDGVSQDMSSNSLGTFAFNSLSDLAASRPSSFRRAMSAPTLSGSVWNGFIAASDLWRVSPNLQIMYGARVEGDRFTSAPELNPMVQSTFGLRTDNAPNTMHVSPRVGFTWVRQGSNGGMRFNKLGQFAYGPKSYIRGGIGEFRNIFPANLLANASVATGLPTGLRSLTCIGPATPAPEWDQYLSNPGTIPTQCHGAGAPTFTDVAPSVQLFDPSYTAPRTWRGNLAYSSSYKLLAYSVEGLYSLNLSQPGRVNVNFNNIPKFTLADEGRPVFVAPASIVGSSGAVSTVESRVAPSFGPVIDNVSNLTSRSKQLTVSASPVLSGTSNWFTSLNYTLADTRARQSGFDGSTFASPSEREWARGDLDIRHQILLEGGYSFKSLTFTFFGRLQSGLPFTPMVGGDVNGDGLANDRAFIFNPATMGDASLANATRDLLAASSSSVRDCLTRQMGRPASRNSCEGPWTTSLNAELTYSGNMPITHQYGSIALAFSNPFGGLDQLLHGANHLRGWGTAANPDQVLYMPTGFDAGTDRFNYAINPRFGSSNPANTLSRSPFRVTLDVSLTLGRPLNQQQINRWIKPGRGGRPGPRLSVNDLERRYSRSVPDPYKAILQQSDSLLLTREQADALQSADNTYRQRVDSVWTALSEYLASLPDQYSPAEALNRQEAAVSAGWELTKVDVQRTLPTILSPIQLRLLPGVAAYLMRTKGKVGIRLFLGN